MTTAEVTDRSSAVNMVNDAQENLSAVKNILVDAGYTGENFATRIKEVIGATVEVVKRNELHKFVVLPKRSVVERFGWINVDGCEKTVTSLQMIVLAFAPKQIRYRFLEFKLKRYVITIKSQNQKVFQMYCNA